MKHGRRHRKLGITKNNRGITGRVLITEKPLIVDTRALSSDYEVDLMILNDHKITLLVALDLTSLQTILKKLYSKNGNLVKKAVI